MRFLEVADVNNKATLDHEEFAKDLLDTGLNTPQPGQQINDIHAQWHPEANAWIVDMSAANGTFLVLGAFQEMDRHRPFETVSDQIELDRAVESEINALDRPDWPDNLDDLTARELGLALWKEITLDPGSRQQYSFYYAVASSAEEALGVAQHAQHPEFGSFVAATNLAYGFKLRPGLWNDDRSH